MLPCKEMSRLISQSLDRKLPFHLRLGVWIHLLFCDFCSRYAKQITLMRNAARRLSMEGVEMGSSSLSLQARERIKHSLETGSR